MAVDILYNYSLALEKENNFLQICDLLEEAKEMIC